MGGLCCHCVYPSTSDIEPHADLTGRVALVTGVTKGGIGYVTAKVLAQRGATLVLCGRNKKVLESSARAIESSIKPCCSRSASTKKSLPNIHCIVLDLSDLSSVRECVAEFTALGLPLHILVNNAGILSPGYKLTKQGFESQMGVNYLGHFYLTFLLMHILRASATPERPVRIVNVSSVAHQQSTMTTYNLAYVFKPEKERYDDWTSYGCSKLANILHARMLHRRYGGTENILAVSLHPGVISTALGGSECYIRCFCYCCCCFLKSVDQGSSTSVYACLSPAVKGGEYYDDCEVGTTSHAASSQPLADALWQVSVEMVKKFENDIGVADVERIMEQEEKDGLPRIAASGSNGAPQSVPAAGASGSPAVSPVSSPPTATDGAVTLHLSSSDDSRPVSVAPPPSYISAPEPE